MQIIIACSWALPLDGPQPHYLIERTGQVLTPRAITDADQQIIVALANAGRVRMTDGRWLAVEPEADGSLRSCPVAYEFCTCQRRYWPHRWWEMYPQRQVEALCRLLRQLSAQHHLPLRGLALINRAATIPAAQQGAPGIWAASATSADRQDPQPESHLVNALRRMAKQ